MKNVDVVVLSDTSVRVSWKRVKLQSTNYVRMHNGYIIFYSQTSYPDLVQSVTLPNTADSVLINNLVVNSVYLFQVAAIIQVDETVFVGKKTSVEVQVSSSKFCS